MYTPLRQLVYTAMSIYLAKGKQRALSDGILALVSSVRCEFGVLNLLQSLSILAPPR